MMKNHDFIINSLEQTEQLAQKIVNVIVPDFVVTLNAPLGAGKTTLVRDILYALGVKGTVKSPTYTLVEEYKVGDFDIYHFDLYRFVDKEEWFYIGFDEYFTSQSIIFIEWANKALGLIPQIDWEINISIQSESRVITIISKSIMGAECLRKLTLIEERF